MNHSPISKPKNLRPIAPQHKAAVLRKAFERWENRSFQSGVFGATWQRKRGPRESGEQNPTGFPWFFQDDVSFSAGGRIWIVMELWNSILMNRNVKSSTEICCCCLFFLGRCYLLVVVVVVVVVVVLGCFFAVFFQSLSMCYWLFPFCCCLLVVGWWSLVVGFWFLDW